MYKRYQWTHTLEWNTFSPQVYVHYGEEECAVNEDTDTQ